MQNLEEYTLDAITTGVQEDEGTYTCLACGARFEEGEVYPLDGRFFTAQRAAAQHAQTAHGPWLEALLSQPGRYLALTEHQKTLVRLLAAGQSDAEVAKHTGASPATVRRQRFAFREKAKRAKMYLAVYALMEAGRAPRQEELVPIRAYAPEGDERFAITEKENARILQNAFESMQPLRLRAIPAKEKKKVAVLNVIATAFAPGREYTEPEVNAVLKEIYPEDHVSLRRYLVEYGFMQRQANGSRYCLL